ANKDGFHVRNVSVARDLAHATVADLRTVNAGEGCPRCGSPLAVGKALEVGHIFKLGTRYSESMGARVLDEAGKEVPIVMGSYGIGVERILAAAVELHHDADGIRWPMSIAPLHVALLPLQMQDAQVREAGERLYRDLTVAGVDVLLDDRDERPGAKFKHAGHVGMVKVGLELFVAHGRAAVDAVRPSGLPIFLDLKLHDIPQTVEGAARGAGALGTALVTAHASGGADMIAAARRGLAAG